MLGDLVDRRVVDRFLDVTDVRRTRGSELGGYGLSMMSTLREEWGIHHEWSIYVISWGFHRHSV